MCVQREEDCAWVIGGERNVAFILKVVSRHRDIICGDEGVLFFFIGGYVQKNFSFSRSQDEEKSKR